MTDDFSDHPISLAETRADRENNGGRWTPRDALIHILREIDRGNIDPVAIAVIYTEKLGDSDTRTRFVQSSPSSPFLLGMIELAKHLMLRGWK